MRVAGAAAWRKPPLTMYELPASLLTDNPVNRYLINSPKAASRFTSSTSRQAGTPKPTGCLRPGGPVLREHWPKPEALDGTWKAPPAVRTASSIPVVQPKQVV
jgi:hypothetical protein